MRQTREIHKEISVNADADEVFNALITPSLIREWWGAHSAVVLAEPDGIVAIAWGDDEDDPDYLTVSRITLFEPPSSLQLSDYRYRSRNGALPFDNDLPVMFTVVPNDEYTILRVHQSGFPAEESADIYYDGCVKGWTDTLASIKKVLEQ